jgi:hypothetical protein
MYKSLFLAGGNHAPSFDVDYRLQRRLFVALSKVETDLGLPPSTPFERMSEQERQNRVQTGECRAIASSYIAPLIAVDIIGKGFDARDLTRAWWVIRAIANKLVTRCDLQDKLSRTNLDLWTLSVHRQQLCEILSACCNFSVAETFSIIKFLTYDQASFRLGLWSMPLVSTTSGDVLGLCLPALVGSSPVRRVEQWIKRGAGNPALNEDRRGKVYERSIRDTILLAGKRGRLRSGVRCLKHAYRLTGADVGDIDLLLYFRKILIVAEIKSQLMPTEPLEYYNYWRKMHEAARQVRLETSWSLNNLGKFGRELCVSNGELEWATVVPLIVVNQSHGVSCEVGGIRIVDFHLLYSFISRPDSRLGDIRSPYEPAAGPGGFRSEAQRVKRSGSGRPCQARPAAPGAG